MAAFTARSWPMDRAPKRITLLGDKTVRTESAQHIIEFPGGAVEVSRTFSGDYWAHVIVNRGLAAGDCNGLASANGVVVAGRIDADDGVHGIPFHENICQIAILISPVRAA